MELEKRVEGVENELKVVKGEIKELLVDIRNLVNRNENPFYNRQKHGVFRLEAKEKEEAVENQTPSDEEKDLKPSESFPETELENKINNESKQDPTRYIPENPSSGTPEQRMLQKEMQANTPEILFRKIDTFTLVELMRWVDYSVRTIGHNNLEKLLDLYELTGQLSEENKYVIENIAILSIEEPAREDRVSMKDNITVLSQLSAILNPEEFKNRLQSRYEDSSWREDKKG